MAISSTSLTLVSPFDSEHLIIGTLIFFCTMALVCLWMIMRAVLFLQIARRAEMIDISVHGLTTRDIWAFRMKARNHLIIAIPSLLLCLVLAFACLFIAY